MMTRYKPGMKYGAHADAAFIQLPGGDDPKRPQLHHLPQRSGDYDGGELHISLGDAELQFKLKPGEAIVYPSDTLHQVDPVTTGERLVAITFIQSRDPDPFRRNLLFELNEVAALEGLKMERRISAGCSSSSEPAALLGRHAVVWHRRRQEPRAWAAYVRRPSADACGRAARRSAPR